MSRPVRVLIIDDSALMRQLLSDLLNADPGIEVVDTASDPLIARESIKRHNPDVITLDVEMPRMNGIEFLRKIMTLRPTPVVMISTLTQQGADTTIQALEIGAVDFVGKPSGLIADGFQKIAEEIATKVKNAAQSRVRQWDAHVAAIPAGSMPPASARTRRLVAIGASTGGVPAIGTIIRALPRDFPPVLITQHMPPGFTIRFAAELNRTSVVTVTEAEHRCLALPGHVYIAPGGKQMSLSAAKGALRLEVIEGKKVNGFCPSVDVLFDSVAESLGARAIGVLLTGMGQDGARGMVRLRHGGALTIGQDEATAVVYGMPRVAYEMGGVTHQLPIHHIARKLMESL